MHLGGWYPQSCICICYVRVCMLQIPAGHSVTSAAYVKSGAQSEVAAAAVPSSIITVIPICTIITRQGFWMGMAGQCHPRDSAAASKLTHGFGTYQRVHGSKVTVCYAKRSHKLVAINLHSMAQAPLYHSFAITYVAEQARRVSSRTTRKHTLSHTLSNMHSASAACAFLLHHPYKHTYKASRRQRTGEPWNTNPPAECVGGRACLCAALSGAP